MATFKVSNATPTPTVCGGYQSDTGSQFSSDFNCPLNKGWKDFELWWDATAKWPKIVSKNSLDCKLLFSGTSVPNAIINNNDSLSPYSEIITNNAVDDEFWFNSNIMAAPSYTPDVDNIIKATSRMEIYYFDGNVASDGASDGDLLRWFAVDMSLLLVTSDPAFPVNPGSFLKFNVNCWEI